MRKYLPLIIILFSGCSEAYFLERQEDKLIGTWEFDHVYYRADDKLFRDDITEDYRLDVIEFLNDYSALYDDYSTGQVFDGEWIIRVDKDISTEGSSTEYFIDAMFYGMFQGDNFDLFGSIDMLNKKKFQLEGRDRNGTYTLTLVRL